MKYYSETLKKMFDTETELNEAEESFEKTKSADRAEYDKLHANYEAADEQLKIVRKNYEEVRKECAKILEESNKQVEDLMDEAKVTLDNAIKARDEAKQKMLNHRLSKKVVIKESNDAISDMLRELFNFC